MFEVPAPQSFAYVVGDTVSNGVPAVGAGNMETIASKDRYTFSIPAAGARLQYQELSGYKAFSVVNVESGATVARVVRRRSSSFPPASIGSSSPIRVGRTPWLTKMV